MTERQRTVALLIDYDNLQICYTRDAPGTQLDLGAVMALAQNYGRVVVARAYAEWNLLSERLAVYKAGIEPAFAPVLRPEGSNREGKSLADTVMVSDGVDLLWTHQPDVLVLVTSDKDMVPLARIAKQRGCLVVVLGSDLTAVQLIEMANEFVTYRHLVKELGRPEEKLAPARIREEPRLRRSREPLGSPEIAAAREASLRQPRTPPGRSRTRADAAALPAPAAAPRAPAARPSRAPASLPTVEPEVLPSIAPEAATGPSDEPSLPGDDQLLPLATRRRRRRRRRPGAGGEQGVEGLDHEATGSEEQDERVDLELELSGDLVERQVPADESAEAPHTPGMPGSESNERPIAPTEYAPEPESAATPALREEPPALKPWERWPESPPAPTPPVRGVRTRRAASRTSAPATPEPAAEQNGPAAEAMPEPAAAAPEADPVAVLERASLPAAEVQAEVAAEWSPSAATEDGPAVATDEKPAAPRRTRRRRPAAPKTATAIAPAEGE